MAERRLVVASFNIHAGMDGYGRRFDLVEAVKSLEADVVVLQEVFSPLEGPSQGEEIASRLGFECADLPLARARRTRGPLPAPDEHAWEPSRPYARSRRALQVGGCLTRAPKRPELYEDGSWGLALLTKERPTKWNAVSFGRLRRDVTSRAAIVAELADGLVVVGTHMAHATHGSLLHLLRLRDALPRRERPAVLAGDMNFWGPPLELLLPGWRRGVKGKTWPAWRPRHQLDHIFLSKAVSSGAGGPVRVGNSDHLPIRAEIAFAP